MFKILKTRINQKYRTIQYPENIPEMPDRYLGLPEHDISSCKKTCHECIKICPMDAITKNADRVVNIDLGKCIFCGQCQEICNNDAIKFTSEHRMVVSNSSDLMVMSNDQYKHALSVKNEILKIFKRSLNLRQVSAGGCNACEADTNVLSTVGYDLSRFGVSFVASPRHADGLVVTGPVTKNMEEALRKTYEAVSNPKIVIAVGTCAISGGLFKDHDETNCGVDDIIPVDFYIPGCPPHPLTILDGILTVINRNIK